MQIYFGATDDTDGTYVENNRNYYYMLESSPDGDGVVLHDCCDRRLPFSVEEIPALIAALTVYMEEEGEIDLLIEELQSCKEDSIIAID